jgi:catechol 2,3-dioxygenase-like lactoylglutathione lyase family enzyme
LTPATPKPSWTLDHIGLSVDDLQTAVGFWTAFLGTAPVVRRIYDADYIADLTGFPGARLDIAIYDFSEDVQLELIEYLNEPRSERPDRATPGTSHMSLRTDQFDESLARAISAGASIAGAGPTLITSGPNRGGRICYLDLPGHATLELFQPAGDR